MKTKITLSILGVYNTLMGVIMIFFATAIGNEIVLSENTDALKMGELFHYDVPRRATLCTTVHYPKDNDNVNFQ